MNDKTIAIPCGLKFPKHLYGMNIYHNQHLVFLETAKSRIEMQFDLEIWGREDFENDEAIAKCIETDEIWEITWYPETQVSFYRVLAPTFEDAIRLATEGED